MEEKQKEDIKVTEKVQIEIDKLIKEVVDDGISSDNLDYLYRLIDIHKDLANEEYWNVKKEGIKMRYRGSNYSDGYGEYSDGSMGGYGEYGEYSAGGSYGRRGVKGTGRGRSGRGRYRGDEMMDEMQFHYGNYSEGKEEYNAGGSYGAKQDTIKSLDYMMKSVVQFIEMLEQDASSQEEINIIKKYTKKISEM